MNNPTIEINEQLLAAMGLNAEATAIVMEHCINRDKTEMQTLRDRLMLKSAAYEEVAQAVTLLQSQVVGLEKVAAGLRIKLEAIARGKEPLAKRVAEEALGIVPAPTPPAPSSN